ncbi:unnamed protein product [Closterium sp. NIES-64]|nr:unnamed protein product [Closterium sp. NIES-64]
MSKRDTSATSAWTVDALMARADAHVATKEYARSTLEEIIDEEAYAAARARVAGDRDIAGSGERKEGQGSGVERRMVDGRRLEGNKGTQGNVELKGAKQ